MKAVLALQHQTVPANLHLNQKSSHIKLGAHTCIVPLQRGVPSAERPAMRPLARLLQRNQCASVLEEAPRPQPVAHRLVRPSHVLALSAQTEFSLTGCKTAYAAVLAKKSDRVADICFTANAGRVHFDLPLRGHGTDSGANPAVLEEGENASSSLRRFTRTARACDEASATYLGQSSQLWGYGAGAVRGLTGLPGGCRALRHRLEAGDGGVSGSGCCTEGESTSQQARHCAAGTVCVGVRAVGVVAELGGIEPSVVLGHSLGEYVAAWWRDLQPGRRFCAWWVHARS